MRETKEIDVIPDTNNGIVREVINAMFYKSILTKHRALKTARYNYYKAKQNDFGSDVFIIFKLYGYIIEVEGRWYGNGDEECWFTDYNWSYKVKNKPTDWGNYYPMDNPYDFARKVIIILDENDEIIDVEWFKLG